MTSKAIASTTLLLALNLLFFTLVTSTYCPPPPSPKPKSPSHYPPKPKTPSTPKTPKSKTPSTPKTPATPKTPSWAPKTPATPPTVATCPIDALKLGVCANVLSGLLNIVIGTPPDNDCCPLLAGLADLEAAVCLCTAINANVLGLSLNIAVDLSLLLNHCGKKVPTGFECY